MKTMLTVFSAALLIVSCAPSTPQARIQRNPEKYAALSSKQQSLVQRGEIARGMPPDAVYLAWGGPSGIFQGSREGQTSERWDYSGSQPVYTTGFYSAYGYGAYGCGPYGRHGRYGYPDLGFGMGPEITYIPYRIASVWFVDRKVDSWERAR